MVLLIALEPLEAVQDCFGFFRSHDVLNGVCDAVTKQPSRQVEVTRSVYDVDVCEVACVEEKLKGAVKAKTLVGVCATESARGGSTFPLSHDIKVVIQCARVQAPAASNDVHDC